ncbi:hypothetical protein LTS07_004332 [Exophiala sideris]|nr:hypothetical protein LTS07_004332 [Exophiala sideris]KAK5040641.1 hypothetical protein LTR13_002941 [Exophiala sideris]
MNDLKIRVQQWTEDEAKANGGFYTALRGVWDTMVPWYKLEEPYSEAGAQTFRNMMKFGGGGWPARKRLDDIAENIPVASRSGAQGLYLRVFKPATNNGQPPKGVYLHFHGGGWTVGSADVEDEILYRIACNTGYTVASMEYRLAPKSPYPAPIEDCMDAALYLLSPEVEASMGPLRVIGGESAGAHLTMVTVFGLRTNGVNVRSQLDAIVLNYGCYDMDQTPSVRAFTDNLVLSRTDMVNFGNAWLSNVKDRQVAEISPLYQADWKNLPPAIFVVGSDDCLYDDTLFAAIKWHMGGNDTQLSVFPNSKHGFCRLNGPDCNAGLSESETFVNDRSRE